MCEGCICIECTAYLQPSCYYFGKNDFFDYYKKVQADKKNKLKREEFLEVIKIC